MLSSVEQSFVGSYKTRAPLKTPAWEVTKFLSVLRLSVNPIEALCIAEAKEYLGFYSTASLHSKSFRSNCCQKVGLLRAEKRDALVPTFLTNSPEN